MKVRLAIPLAASFFLAVGMAALSGQELLSEPDPNPTGNTGALKTQIETGGSYDAHSGNGTRIVPDLHLPGALGVYGLDFVRYWNSLPIDHDNPDAASPSDFGVSAWSHSWGWSAVYGEKYPEEVPGCNCNDNTYTTSITITFPDGHVNKYKIARFGPTSSGPGDPRFGPPYSPGEITSWTTPPGAGVHDYVGDMASDGHEFWLYGGDGGSVHFVGELPPDMSEGHAWWSYLATEVFDPHGLRTALTYNSNGHLTRVEQEGGRWLTITWGYPIAWSSEMITQVSSGGTAGSQSVSYFYTAGPVLSTVTYPDDPAPGQSVSAIYTYQPDPDTSDGRYTCGLRLVTADDPRFPGPMRTIHYSYRGSHCDRPLQPPNPVPPGYYDRFYALSNSITAEESGDHNDPATNLPVTVSRFYLNCLNGTRTEWNGFGAWRIFYFGSAAAVGEDSHAYQTGKVTDYTLTSVNDVPNVRQSHRNGEPYQIWDGRGIETLLQHQDGSGLPTEIRHTGSDGSFRTYDRITPGNSAPPDPNRIRNPYHHWLFNQTDERILTTTYTRDERRRITHIAYHGGSAEDFTYDPLTNQVTSHTLSSGAIVTYEYDPTSHRLLREYNSVDGYDARKEYTYDSLERVATVSDGRSRSAGKDFSTRMTYNGRHKTLTVEYAGMIGAANPTVAYGYDGYGNCTSITDEMGHTSLYTYDSYRRCTSYTEPLNASNWNGSAVETSRRWDWFYDRYIDGVGQFGAYTHTKNEWRIQIEPAFNAVCDRRMAARAHDLQNRIVIESTGWIQPCNQPIGNWYWSPTDGENHYFSYDENGQKQTYTDPRGRLTTYTYDLRNRLKDTIETKRADQSANPTTTILYDTTSNKTLVTFPDGKTQQWLDYDPFGQPGRFIDERNNTTNLTYQWGPMKKLNTVTTHRIKDSGPTNWEDQLTTFYYDGMGRPQWTIFPDSTSELTTYLFGQVDAFKTRRNQSKRVHYDARGREDYHTWDSDAAPGVSRSWDDANRLTSITNIWSSIDFGYDDAGQVIWEGDEIAGSGGRTQTNYYRYPDGSVAHLHYPGGAYVRHDYTARGQLAATGWDDDDNNWWMKLAAYTYLSDGKVGRVDYGNGMQSALGYDERGLTQIVDHYNVTSNQNYSWRQYWRDNRDRITAFQKSYNPGANPMENGRGDRFRYDWEGQLVDGWYNAVDPAGSFNTWTRMDHFTYDQLGNRQGGANNLASRNSGSACSFFRRDNGLNQYSHWWPAGVDYGLYYDDNFNQDWHYPGNGVMMADGWLVASYNALNQPVAMWSFTYQGTPNFLWFGYDPLGRCVKRWVGDSGDVYSNPATYFHYDGWSLLQEGNNAWGPARVYVHGNRTDEIVWSYNTFTGEQAFHHYDARNHCTLLTDSSGSILEQYEYDAFGQPYFYDASGNSIGSYDLFGQWQGYSIFGNRFLFTGREWLSDVRLYDFRNRMYQPELGRFLQPDPKEFAAGDYNLYRYCHNDPVNKSDPTGLYWEVQEFNHDDNWKIWQMILTSEKIPGPVGDRFRYIATSPYRMVIIPIQTDPAGQASHYVGAREPGDRTNQTTANDPINNLNGRGVGSRVEFDPNNAKDPAGNPRAPIDAFGHEAGGHGYRNITGTNSGDKAKEEQEARKFQIEFHKALEKLKKE